MKLVVGQTVVVVGGNNPVERIVTKVGKKYFEVFGLNRERFFIDNLLQDGRGYTLRYKVYLTMDEVKLMNESYGLNKIIREYFYNSTYQELPIEKRRQIVDIITSSPTP